MNTERPTPETDANELTFDGAEYVSDVVSSDFARKLERERDEITERWEKAANAYLIERGAHEATMCERDEAIAARNHNRICVERLTIERDEAREREAKWEAECKRQWMHLSQARHNAIAIQNIRWGFDGDCGATRLANLIEEDCDRGMMANKDFDALRSEVEQ